jgi:SNF2 family DNA or RNA helicase
MVQAEGRRLRISQEQPVNVTYLLSKGTIDEDMYELIYQKQAAINEAIDHKSRTEKATPLSIRDFVDEMLKRREKKR